ncbi:hypothetical protein B0I72DRAFT_9260 [Yarrowia lipolytica]|jgi:hypothetical protein|uniref:YALI0B06688p n=2 Tax=Yarrowia lipolytica TaxID=4952 RepID=Q6CFI6_YARLI|nr:YALI0B06688p [Yarrowia lipolytica CLIB122]AOW01319.1 hypothetical protein YALI1_B08721g [Yarrowia lipolytica]KAB8285403.1 hypothetical protein BKA91DRAFT_39830 [Yarrowia lipolytica]KAE8169292.1 hypothetical protein BKA90DRAFT_49987 [Yarrowia lipolytica]KAJ8052178.1 hypothetical protein LXG23DRAFT_38236 [Yarrowia lipolytica]QNP97292.1 Hypothetical protein YALI2_C00945g [Yarrowia lipolytica]|eukprot:XP_500576.1 YALI0B06688p [Yarrowia lipolytica CLIB122]
MLASPFEPQASFDSSSSRDSWRDSWRSSQSGSVNLQNEPGREYRGLVDTAELFDFTFKPLQCSDSFNTAAANNSQRRFRLMPSSMKVQPLRVNKSAIRPSKTPTGNPMSAWSDSDDSESDYETNNSICDSDTDVEGCQCLPKYAGLPILDSPKSQSSEFTVQALKPVLPTKPVPNHPTTTHKRGPRGHLKTPMLSPSETVMERYAPLEWSDAARDALKIALDKRQRVMEDAGVSHFIQIEALHNCLKDVAFGVSLRETV